MIKRNYNQYGPQYPTTLPLPPLWCTWQPLLSWNHLRSSIPTPCWTLCWKFRVLLLRSNPWGPNQKIQVDFMGDVDYFLGTAFTWIKKKYGKISVHLCQLEFTEFTAHRFLVHSANKFPDITPYRSRFPIDPINPVDPLDPDLTRWRQVYQCNVGCINWMATWTHPDIYPEITFIASYRNDPHPKHYKASVHDIKYLTNTNECGI